MIPDLWAHNNVILATRERFEINKVPRADGAAMVLEDRKDGSGASYGKDQQMRKDTEARTKVMDLQRMAEGVWVSKR